MPTATLSVELPEEVWVGRVSRRYPEATIRVLAAVAEDRSGVVVAEFRAEDLDGLMADVREAADVTDVTELRWTDTDVLAQVETSSAILLEHAQRSGVPIDMPFTVSDGTTVLELTTAHERLSELGDLFEGSEILFTVESISHDVDREDLLTDTQRDVLVAAIRRGYYDTPRTCTQTELAEHLSLAKSTCSEILHRTEERVLKQFVDQHPGIDLEVDREGTRAGEPSSTASSVGD